MEIYRTTARNTAPDSENRMHDDAVAATYGFKGGLVPGVTVYGYMVHTLGAAFLESGGMKLRLLKPFYDGDTVIVEQPDSATVLARNAEGETCASGTLATRLAIIDVPESDVPDDSLGPGSVLRTLRRQLDRDDGEALLELSNRVLMSNVKLGPWIHAASELQHYSRAQIGEEVSVRARVAERYEKSGHKFVVLDVAVHGEDGRLIQGVRHTAIYEPRHTAPAAL